MRFLVAILIGLGLQLSAHAAGFSRADVEAMLARSGDLSLTDRIETFSERFLGTPYVLDGFGEGEMGEYDRDPLWRFDVFDCTTFVETITALAVSSDFEFFESHLQKIRYEHGKISYVTRNHFPELDWVPNNIRAGFYHDITAEVAGSQPVDIATAVVDKKTFYAKKKMNELNVPGATDDEKKRLLAQWRSEGARFEKQVSELPYISLKTIFPNHRDILDRIPSGAVLNIVRPGWNINDPDDGSLITQMNISHQGLVIRKNGKPYLRNASSISRKVVDLPLESYLEQLINHRTIKGIHLLKID